MEFIFGFILLLIGAEALVRGGAAIARMLGISPLIIGLTIVGYGTSSPELAVSAIAAYQGEMGLSLGNIIGSNIFNLLVILGVLAMIRPFMVHSQIVTFDLPVMLAVTIIVFLLCFFPTISWWWAFPLLMLLAVYTWKLVLLAQAGNEIKIPFKLWKGVFSLFGVVFGLFLLIEGSDRIIVSTTDLARTYGISEFIIGATIVAAGTSIPELATSLVACYRKENDLALGNVIGSNIYNLLAILGISLLVSKNGIDVPTEALHFDLPVLLGVTLLVYPVLLRKRRMLKRPQGIILFLLYFVYIALKL
jgi:cation:H+ antiporter